MQECRLAQEARLETLHVLLNHPQIDVNLCQTVDGSTPLHLATKADIEATIVVVGLLLEHGAIVMVTDANGFTPLHHASASASFATMTHLVAAAQQQGSLDDIIAAQTIIRQHSPLHMAARGSSEG